MILACLGLGAIALLLSAVLTRVLVAVGRRVGAMDAHGAPGHAKTEIRRVPNIGGVAIVLGVALPMLVGLLAAHTIDFAVVPDVLSAVERHIPGIIDQTPGALVLLGCLGVLHVVGLVDDRKPLGPWPKLGAMIGVAGAAVLLTDNTRLLTFLDQHAGGAWLSIVLTIAWIVIVTNAMNFIDNMDGLCAGVGAIAGGLFLAATLIQGQWFVAAALALLVGSLLGFLIFNRPPARIFMGDGGSLVVGFLLAFLTVRTTWYAHPDSAEAALMPDAPSVWYGVFMPLVVLAVPLYDFVSVTAIRLAQGKSPFVGDMQHLSHRLVGRGMSTRAAVAVIWGLTLVTGIGGVSLGSLAPWQAVLVGVQTVAALAVLGVLEFAWRKRA